MIKVLNAFSGIGGSRLHWFDCDVTAVDNSQAALDLYAHYFPRDKCVLTDAFKYILVNHHHFDFIAASPPCQSHSRLNFAQQNKVKGAFDIRLYELIDFLQKNAHCPWYVENVIPYYKPLIPPNMILGRHLFWSNFKIEFKRFNQVKVMSYPNNKEGTTALFKRYGFEPPPHFYRFNRKNPTQVVRNCLNPEIALHVFKCFLNASK